MKLKNLLYVPALALGLGAYGCNDLNKEEMTNGTKLAVGTASSDSLLEKKHEKIDCSLKTGVISESYSRNVYDSCFLYLEKNKNCTPNTLHLFDYECDGTTDKMEGDGFSLSRTEKQNNLFELANTILAEAAERQKQRQKIELQKKENYLEEFFK